MLSRDRRSLMIAVASIVLSAIAVAFCIFVFTEGRRRYQRDVFLKIHELTISEDQNKVRQSVPSVSRHPTNRPSGGHRRLSIGFPRCFCKDPGTDTDMPFNPAARRQHRTLFSACAVVSGGRRSARSACLYAA